MSTSTIRKRKDSPLWIKATALAKARGASRFSVDDLAQARRELGIPPTQHRYLEKIASTAPLFNPEDATVVGISKRLAEENLQPHKKHFACSICGEDIRIRGGKAHGYAKEQCFFWAGGT